MMHRRAFGLSVPALLAAQAGLAQPAAWPQRPVRILVGFSAATTSDLLARLVAQKLGDRLQVPVVVENREGAGGTIAAGLCARATPDGYTLLMGASGLAMAPRLFRDFTLRPQEDFEPVAMVGYAPNVMVVGPKVAIGSMEELLATARAAPGRLRYASSGPGSGSWVGFETLKAMTGVQLEEIPYTSTAQATTDTISGQIELHCPSLAGALPAIRAGQLRALGITSGHRSAGAPDIPSIAETVPGYDASSWYGLIGPAKLPEPVLARLNAEVRAVLAEPAMQVRLRDAGVDVQSGPPDEFRALMAEAVRSGNALMDNIRFRPG